MQEPRHEQVRLRPSERAEFIAIAQRFGPQPCDPTVPSALGWRNRARVLFFSHLVAVALLLPFGVVAMALAVVVWWPLGLLATGLALIGLLATVELARARRHRRRLRKKPTERNT